MRSTVLFALLCGVQLVHISTAQDENSGESEPISFDNFCTHFDELRSTPSMNNVLRDLESIRKRLLANGVVPERGAVDAVEEVCRDPSKFFDTECLFRNRFLMTIPNSDFIRLHDFTLLGFYVDLFLLHPVFRSCLATLNKDVKSNDVKARLAKGLAGDRPQDFAALFDTRSGKFIRKEIKNSCEKKMVTKYSVHLYQTLLNWLIPSKEFGARAELVSNGMPFVCTLQC